MPSTANVVERNANAVRGRRPNLPQTEVAARAIAEYNRARTKAQQELAEKYRLENLVSRAEYLSRAEISKRLASVADGIISKIMAMEGPREVKEQILQDISEIPLIFEEVAHGQSRHAATKSKKAAPRQKVA